jgi:hypothetical protein
MTDTMRDRSAVVVRDTLTERRWPDWAGKVADLGVRTVLDVPLARSAGPGRPCPGRIQRR